MWSSTTTILAHRCRGRGRPHHQSEQDRKDRDEKSATDHRLVDYTADLAHYTLALFIATLLLAGGTGGLVYYGFKQASDAKRAIAASEKAAKAAETAAAAAETQTAITANQTDILAKQHAVGRLDFLATHRPKLRVRNVVIVPIEDATHSPTLLMSDELIEGALFVSNYGDSVANIDEMLIKVFWTNSELPMRRPYEQEVGVQITDRSVRPGTAQQFNFKSDKAIGNRDSNDILTGQNCRLFVMGWFSYKDEGDVQRRTAFCRKYDPPSGRFRRVDDPDYEHEE